MPEITPELVRHLGVLSRITLNDDELTRLTGQLESIVHSVAKVSEVATASIPATSHPLPLSNVYREDVVGDTLTQEEALCNAPDAYEGRFRVTAILGEEQ